MTNDQIKDLKQSYILHSIKAKTTSSVQYSALYQINYIKASKKKQLLSRD